MQVHPVGSLVRLLNDRQRVEIIQGSKPGWVEPMKDCLGKIGYVKLGLPVDNFFISRVKFQNQSWNFNNQLLTVVPESEIFKLIKESSDIKELHKGDFVRVLNDKNEVMRKQVHHGDWNSDMDQIIGKIGFVKLIFPGGDPLVKFGRIKTYRINKESVQVIISRRPVKRKFHEGQMVRVIANLTQITSLQKGHGEWTSEMKECLGKHVTVGKILSSGDVRIWLDGKLWTMNPSALRLLGENDQVFRVGDHVKILESKEEVERLQNGHGGYPLGMDLFLGKIGEIIEIHPDNDLVAKFSQQKLVLNPLAVVLTEDALSIITLPGVNPLNPFARADPLGLFSGLNPSDDDPLELFSQFKKFLEAHEAASKESSYGVDSSEAGLEVFQAIATGNVQLVKNHIATKGMIDKGPNGVPALHLATFHNQMEMVKLLIANKAKIDTVDSLGKTALMIAVERDNFEIAELLVNANLNTIDIPGPKKCTPLMIAAFQGNSRIVQLLLSLYASNDLVDTDGDTALHDAAIKGHVEIVKLLVECNNSLLEMVNNEQKTALHMAAHTGNMEIAKYLLEKGAKVDLKNAKGRTPLHVALKKEHGQVAELLIEKGSSVTEIDNEGFTPLHLAALKGSLTAARLIISADPEIVDEKKDDGFTAVHIAAMNDHQEILQLLLMRGQADPNSTNNKRETALHLAVRHNKEKSVKILVQNGADFDKQDSSGNTSLHEALKKRNLALFGLFSFMRTGAPVSVNPDIAHFLVSKGANLQIKNNQGETPLNLIDNEELRKKLIAATPRQSRVSSGSDRSRARSASVRRNPAEYTPTVVLTDECSICMVNNRGVVFSCGHSVCKDCSEQLVDCPFCKREIQLRIPLMK